MGWESEVSGRLFMGGLGFVIILLKATSVLCCFVSLAIKRSCSHLPFFAIIKSFWGLSSKEERAVACSQETWFLDFVLGSLFWALLFSDVNQSRAKQTEGSTARSLETDPEMQILTKKEFKAFGQWELLLFTSETPLRQDVKIKQEL